jgi:4-azaleucine resistance transporter AzlC
VSSASRSSEFIGGIRATMPLVVGGIPFGTIFGALAITSGISPAGAMGLSALVYAGSAQFLATTLVAQGTAPLLIVLTTFVVNLRHALYSTTLAPHMKHLPQRWLLPLGFWLTDETFVVVIQRYQQADASPYKHWFHLGSSVIMYVSWSLSTLVGIAAGSAIPDSIANSLGFAMTVTFIGMVVPMMTTRPVIVSVVAAGLTAIIAYPLPNTLWLIVAAIAGVIAGVITETRTQAAFPGAPARQERAEGDTAG